MLTLQELNTVLGGSFIQEIGKSNPIMHVLIDSRKLLFTEQAVFIAIKGIHNNSHAYLIDVYDAGVRNFVIEKNNYDPKNITSLIDANIIEVNNGIEALQTFAKMHRSQFNLEVVGITGSNGKTIVKEWLTHLLKDDVNLVRNPKSYNSQIGVPLSVLQIQEAHQLGIFEAGISEKNEMTQLENIIQPKLGILTLIGDAHDEGFINKEEKLGQKLQLFAHCNKVIYCEDQALVQSHILKKSFGSNQKIFYSWSRSNQQADFFIETSVFGSNTQLICQNKKVQIPFTDEASIWNACTCFAFVLLQNYTQQNILGKFADLPVLDMRLQLKEAHQNCLLINDSYSADLSSLNIALEFMQQHAADNFKTVILSDFLESGKSDNDLYLNIARQLEAFKVDQVIGIGEAISRNKLKFKGTSNSFYLTTKEFLSKYEVTNFSHQIILLKGARSFAFERIGKWLEKKVHQTVFEINLNALIHNLNVYKSLLKPKVKVMAMVKAFSYGAGSYEIARILNFNRVDYLTVAYADEGVVLRKSGIKTPIMVMNPEAHSFDAILKYNLEPEIYNFEIFQSLLQIADGEEIGIHLELDSGMKRLGFDENQLPLLNQLLSENPYLKVRSIFTHLAASEDPNHDLFTQKQINSFEKMSALLTQNLNYPVLLHCLNSGGIARFPNAQFDMVRLGIGLYGVNPSEFSLPLQTIGTLKTVISQVRFIDANESIGYGRNGHLKTAGKIAIVAIGYADGLDRKLSNGIGSMLVNGKLAKIVGNICMDMTMLDVSNIDCKVGDEVIVFGESPNINELSQQIGTIPYEILTGVSQRVKRIYFHE